MNDRLCYKTTPDIIFVFLGFMSVIEYYASFENGNVLYSNFLILQLFSTFVLSYYYTVKRIGFFHIFSLLHVTLFIFAFGGIIASPIVENADFRTSVTPLAVRFKEDVIQQVLSLYSVYICFSFVAFFYFHRKFYRDRSFSLQTNNYYLLIAKKTFLVLFPFALMYAYTMYKIGDGNRVLLYQTGSNDALGVPLYLRITNMLFTASFYLLIASCPRKKVFIKYFSLFMCTMIPILMMGERGEVVVPIIFILWYFYRVYGISIDLLKVFLIGTSIMIVSFIVSVTRMGDVVSGLSVFDMILGFFASSATSFSLLAYYVQFRDSIMDHNYPFFLDSLIGGLTGATGQSMHVLEVRSNIGHQLVYSLNPGYYLAGYSTGTSFIAEMYEFGVCGVIIGTVMLGLFCVLFENKMCKNHFRMLFAYLFFQFLILTPRGSLFVPIYDIIKYILCFCVLKYTIGLFIKNKY